MSHSRACNPFELIHSDLWGASPVPSDSGARYFFLFIDDFSRFTWLYILHSKDQVYPTFLKFKAMVETQFNTKIKCLQSDWGGEYRTINKFLSPLGIQHRISCPHTPEQNGRVERKNRHIVEVGLSLLTHAHMPFKFWSYAFQTAAYLINRLPTPVLSNASPYHTLYNKTLSYTHLRVFGCACFPFLRPYNHNKLEYRSKECTFVGYSSSHKGYLCMDKETGRVYISRHVIFNEKSFPFASSSSNSNSIPQVCPLTSALPSTSFPLLGSSSTSTCPPPNSPNPSPLESHAPTPPS